MHACMGLSECCVVEQKLSRSLWEEAALRCTMHGPAVEGEEAGEVCQLIRQHSTGDISAVNRRGGGSMSTMFQQMKQVSAPGERKCSACDPLCCSMFHISYRHQQR